MRHPFMTGLAEGLTAGGFSVLRFNFPYMDAGRRMPDAAPVLLQTWDAVLLEAVRRAGRLPVVVGGKSMGGRIASMLAADRGPDFLAKALVFFGYPLHPPGKPDLLRDAHLPQVRIPMVFLQGSNDALARLDLIEAVVKRLHPLADLHVVEGGDHSFRRRGGRSSDQANARGVAQIATEHIREIIKRAP
jgi:predicted alpha/beta-hydrolase family hydrolase